jgi:hypothetical protein
MDYQQQLAMFQLALLRHPFSSYLCACNSMQLAGAVEVLRTAQHDFIYPHRLAIVLLVYVAGLCTVSVQAKPPPVCGTYPTGVQQLALTATRPSTASACGNVNVRNSHAAR